jgi:H+/Cl- antiporter ClcA
MSALKTLTAVFLIVALAVLMPRLAWTIFDTHVLSNPDSKFGAQGGIQFVTFFVGLAGAIAGLVAMIVTAVSLLRRRSSARYLLTSLIGGLVLSFLSFWIPDLAVYGFGYSIFGDIGMIMVNWAVVCAVVLILIQVAVGGRLPPNSRFHADARNGARAGEAGR